MPSTLTRSSANHLRAPAKFSKTLLVRKSSGWRGNSHSPAAAYGDVVKEDELVQVVYGQVRVSAPGGGDANDFGAFSHGACCIEQRLFVSRAFDGELELSREVGIFRWHGIQYIVNPRF